MNSLSVSEFRSNMVSALETIKSGEKIELTSHGKAIALIVPVPQAQSKAESQLVELQKTAQVFDVISPIDDQWDSLNDIT